MHADSELVQNVLCGWGRKKILVNIEIDSPVGNCIYCLLLCFDQNLFQEVNIFYTKRIILYMFFAWSCYSLILRIIISG